MIHIKESINPLKTTWAVLNPDFITTVTISQFAVDFAHFFLSFRTIKHLYTWAILSPDPTSINEVVIIYLFVFKAFSLVPLNSGPLSIDQLFGR